MLILLGRDQGQRRYGRSHSCVPAGSPALATYLGVYVRYVHVTPMCLAMVSHYHQWTAHVRY